MKLEEARSAVAEALSEELDPVVHALVLHIAEPREFGAGETVLSKGEAIEPCFYIIARGQVRAEDDNGWVLKTHARPEIVGEIGAVSPQHRRMCRVIADTDCELLAVNVEELKELAPDKCEALLKKLEATAWTRIAGYTA